MARRPEVLFDLKILTCSYFQGSEWLFGNLSDPFWRLYWHRYPGEWMEHDGRPVMSTPDRCTIIAPYTPFAARGRGDAHHLYIHFLAGFPYSMAGNHFALFTASPAMLAMVKALSDRLSAGERRPAEDPLTAVRLCAEALSAVPWESWNATAPDSRVARADAHMTANIGRAVSNEELASLVSMAPNSFVRLFSQITGFAPQQYLARRKIERACLMLQYHDASIEEVAERLGFTDRYYFTRVFKKIMGTGPAAYRKAMQTIGS